MVKLSKKSKFKPEFKAKVEKGRVTFHAVKEKKANGDIVMHMPSLALINKFKRNNKL